MKKTRFLGVLVISLVLFGMAFISCSHEIDLDLGVEAQDRRVGGNDEMSRHEYLTQQKMLENHKVNVDELTRIVSDAFTQTVGSYTPESSNIATTYKRVPAGLYKRYYNRVQ